MLFEDDKSLEEVINQTPFPSNVSHNLLDTVQNCPIFMLTLTFEDKVVQVNLGLN